MLSQVLQPGQIGILDVNISNATLSANRSPAYTEITGVSQTIAVDHAQYVCTNSGTVTISIATGGVAGRTIYISKRALVTGDLTISNAGGISLFDETGASISSFTVTSQRLVLRCNGTSSWTVFFFPFESYN